MPDQKESKRAIFIITVPRLSANDDSAQLVGWLVKPGDRVVAGQEVCEIETTKAVAEIVSAVAGYFTPLVEIGATVAVNAPLAIVSDDAEVDRTAALAMHNSKTPASGAALGSRNSLDRKATRKAELLARRYGIEIATLNANSTDGIIREEDVERMRARSAPKPSFLPKREQASAAVERVLVIGSVRGGGAAIVLDILQRTNIQVPAGVLDRDPATHGTSVLGVPVLGASDLPNIKRLYASGAFDAAIVALNRNLGDRAAVFTELDAAGIPIANAIDATAEIRSGVRIGRGNVVAALTYIGAEACIGDNNFLSSRTTIEHHCVIGSHCGFGPAVTFSGHVKVGSFVRFGTQIAAEPDIEIGDRAIVASSCVLTADVAPAAIAKAIIAHRVTYSANKE